MKTQMLTESITFATIKHKGQVRKVSGKPFVTHPIEVSELIGKYKSSKKIIEIQTAGVLHDTLEDTDTTFIELAEKFSPLVASLVLEVTSDVDMIKKIGKLSYLMSKMLGMSSYGLIVKLCDRLNNVMDNPTEKTLTDTKEILSFLKDNRRLSKTHLLIIADIEVYL